MNIKYWQGFSKRKNSTKQPSGTGTDLTVVMKDNTSREHPTFILSGYNWSMNYIQAFGDYYYVEDIITNTNGTSEVVCSIDPMATFKSNIGSVSALVEYTSSSTNILIPDPRNKPSDAIIEKTNDLLDLSSYGFGGGMFIVGIAGGNGGVTYYEMSALILRNLFNKVYDATFYNALENQFFDLKSCIVSCILVPALPEAETGADQIYVGGQATGIWSTAISRYKTIAETSYDVKFPFGDGIWAEGSENYVDFEYSTGTLYLPFVGVVPLDISVVAHSRQLRLGAEIDWYTGAIVYKIANASGDYLATYEGHFGSTVPVVSQTYNPMGVASGIVGMIGGAAATATGAGIGGVPTMVGSLGYVISSLATHTQVNGSISSAIGNRLGLKAKATVITRTPAEPDLRQYQASSGMPFFQVSTVSALSGYVKCWNASVNCAATPADKEIINGYLNSGFYYE